MTKLMIFGERPGPNTDPKRPLFPHTTTGAAARLIQLLGVTTEQYLSKTIRYNAFHDGRKELDLAMARIWTYEKWLDYEEDELKILMVGRNTANAAFFPEYRQAKFGEVLGRVMVIPHTSGVNRFWNSPEDTLRITLALREFTADCF